MAVRTTTGQFLPATVVSTGRGQVVTVPRGKSVAKKLGRAVGSVAARVAYDEKHTLSALVAAGLLAYARRTNTRLPTIGDFSPPLLYGLAAWAYGKWGKNKTAAHVATGILSVGLFEQLAYDKTTRTALHGLVVEQAERLRTARADEGEVPEGVIGGGGVVGDLVG